MCFWFFFKHYSWLFCLNTRILYNYSIQGEYIMSLLKTIKVAMSTEKITFKRGTKDTIYVYYTVRSCRRKSDNKPTSDDVAIDKRDLETEMLIPNNKYYEIFNIEQSVSYTHHHIYKHMGLFIFWCPSKQNKFDSRFIWSFSR